MFAPAFVHEPVGAVCAAPFEFANVTSTCSPAAGTNEPVPVSFSSVTVNVCGAFTGFVAFGVIEIRAFTHAFCASGLSPASPSPVARVNETPATDTVVVALMSVVPVVGELITTVQEPDPAAPAPGVVQVDGPTNVAEAPFEFVSENMITVPSGAFVKPPEPSFTFTCPVRVWFVPARFDAVAGVIWMFASTQVLLALPEPPEAVFCAVPVVRVIVTPLTGMSEVAWTTVVPAVAELIVTVQLAVAAPPV